MNTKASDREILSDLEHKDGSPIRYVHQGTGEVMVKLSAGAVYVTQENETITTVLGSCVTTCLRDSRSGVGGINHFMLPDIPTSANPKLQIEQSGRYGKTAMETLVSAILRAGGQRNHLEAKVFGGASVIDVSSDIGKENGLFALQWLERNGIPVIAQDLGGNLPRKILYHAPTGRAQLLRLRSVFRGFVAERERRYLTTLDSENLESNENVTPED